MHSLSCTEESDLLEEMPTLAPTLDSDFLEEMYAFAPTLILCFSKRNSVSVPKILRSRSQWERLHFRRRVHVCPRIRSQPPVTEVVGVAGRLKLQAVCCGPVSIQPKSTSSAQIRFHF